MKGLKTNFPTFRNKSCGHYLRVYRAFNAFIRNVNIFIPTLISDEILTDSAKLITGNRIFASPQKVFRF